MKKHVVNDYPVIVHTDDSVGYWVECPVFEGCYSQGKTIDEALKNIQEAIELCAEELPKKAVRQRREIGVHFVRV
ncbi:MAG: type II toxin-antitoxin system HicB family antitoxin [Patescibacteria group bacterium]